MALNAGEVYAILGGRFNPAGFAQFDGAMKKSVASASAAEKQMVASQGRASKATTMLGKAAKTGAAVGVAALGYALYKSVSVAADFEQQLSSLQSVTDANTATMGRLKKQALEAGAATKYSALDAAKAQTELAKGGLSVQQIMSGGLKAALALAAAGEMDLGDAASTTANAINLFGLEGDRAVRVADALATAANATTADVGDFAMALTQGGSAAKAAGLSFDETVAALEALANRGVKGSDAGTSLKAALTQLASPTKKSSELMKELGVQVFDAQGKIKPLPAIAANLRESLGGLTRQQRLQAATTLVGTDGMRALLALYDAGPKRIREWENGLARQGTAAEVARKKQDNFKGAMENLQGSLETLGIIVGTTLLPALTDGAQAVTRFLNQLQSGKGDVGQLGRELSNSFRGIGTVISTLSPALKAAFQFFSAPLRAGLNLIGALGAALRGDFGGALAGVGNAVRASVNGILAPLRLLDQATGRIGSSIASALTGSIGGAFRAMAGVVRGGASAVLSVLGKMLAGAAKVVGAMAGIPVIGGKFKGLQAGVQLASNAVNRLAAEIKGVPSSKKTTIENTAAASRVKVAAYTAAVRGVPPRKITQILQNAPSARVAIQQLTAAIRGVPPSKHTTQTTTAAQARATVAALTASINAIPASRSSSITITTTRVNRVINELTRRSVGALRAAGRGAIGSEDALIGEGRGDEYRIDRRTGLGYRTAGPELTRLGPDEYVVPLESRYRGRALGLFAQLGRDLGVPGYAKGRRPKKPKPKRYRPRHLDPLSLPVDDLESRERNAVSAVDSDRSTIDSLKGQIGTAEFNLRYQKGKGQARARRKNQERIRKLKGRLAKAQAQLRRHQADLKQRRAELFSARSYAGKLDKQRDLVDIYADEMTFADNRNDQRGYDAARGRRGAALAALRSLLVNAQRHVPADSKYWRVLQKELGQVAIAAGETAAAKSQGQQSAEDAARQRQEDIEEFMRKAAEPPPPREMLTDGQQAEEDRLDANIALSRLTESLDDDRWWMGAKATFLEQVLGGLRSTGAPNALIAQAADQLRSARDDLAGLTAGPTGTATPSAPDPAEVQRQVREQLEGFSGAMRDLYESYGSNFRGNGDVNFHFEEPPPDPHSWARAALFELQAGS